MGKNPPFSMGPGDTYDVVRAGARLVLLYEAATQTFSGSVTNTTSATLRRVSVAPEPDPCSQEIKNTNDRRAVE